MKEQKLKIKSNIELTRGIFEMMLLGDFSSSKCGMFLELKLDGFFLQRPFGLSEISNDFAKIAYRVVGNGTKFMTSLNEGQELDALTDLGNGFDLSLSNSPLIIGGGMGAAPLLPLAKKFKERGIQPKIILGFRNKSEAYYIEEFKQCGEVFVATDDGSLGSYGNAVETIKSLCLPHDFYYACGPQIMLKNLARLGGQGQVSLEARMGCGFGACMGCSIMTKNGPKRVCKEGPVFFADEVIFD